MTFDDLMSGALSASEHSSHKTTGARKVLEACNLAREDGYEWIWIDSCCIDKSSSAVLQESINSMWSYYSNANICYVYMADVANKEAGWTESFVGSEWFDRGWTLQELIAPDAVEFYAQDWSEIGTKHQRCDEIARRTNIPTYILLNPRLFDLESAAHRMSWAAHRRTTRAEDQAYSLLGLFQINMPMLYGEGEAKAFGRLVEAIYNATRDDSLFLFRYSAHRTSLSLVPDSPTRFCPRRTCVSCQEAFEQCLPESIQYVDVIASQRWAVQSHEQLLTTVSPSRSEASTTLLLLPKAVIPDSWLRDCDPLAGSKFTHVALLNHTLMGKPNGAFCLLLQFGNEDAALRLSGHPVFVANCKNWLSDVQKKKVLIALELRPKTNVLEMMTFSVKSDHYYAYSWEVDNPTDVEVSGLATAQSRCTFRCTADRDRPLLLTCLLFAISNIDHKIVVRLKRADDLWLIFEAAKHGNRSRVRKGVPKTALIDRHVLETANGAVASISVRRLAARKTRIGIDGLSHSHTRIGIDMAFYASKQQGTKNF